MRGSSFSMWDYSFKNGADAYYCQIDDGNILFGVIWR